MAVGGVDAVILIGHAGIVAESEADQGRPGTRRTKGIALGSVGATSVEPRAVILMTTAACSWTTFRRMNPPIVTPPKSHGTSSLLNR